VVFPRSRESPRWPVSGERLQRRVEELLAGIGGWDRILSYVERR